MERFQGHINPYFFDRKPDLQSCGFKEEILQESVPFLQMLQSEEPSFLTLMSLKDPWELESYLSHEVPQFHSPVQSIEGGGGNNQALSSQELVCSQANMIVPSSSVSPRTTNPKRKRKIGDLLPQETGREKRKRRRPIPSKNIEEIETQRINHIAVERNRRRLMNEHISSLRSLLPPSYIQRGDQASIVGGAINYVKNLEQIIQSLESQRTTQRSNEGENRVNTNHLLWTTQEDQTCVPKIEATMIQNHVSLKIQCQKKQGQLLKGIISLEKLKLTVLHLNITSSSHSSVSYSFNLKMEDDCDLESAEEIKAAAHRIFEVRRHD